MKSSINELPKNEFYKLSKEEQIRKLEEIWKEIDETSMCISEELMEELWRLRGKI